MKKILIVDNDIGKAKDYGGYLAQDGYEIEYAEDGEVGLAKVKEFKPNLILTEVEIPKVDGITFLKILKEDEEIKYIPVLILTREDVPEKRMEAVRLGVTIYFEKAKVTNELLRVWVRELTQVNQEEISQLASMREEKAKVLLLIEDDPLMLKLYKRGFELAGFEVDLAAGGKKGLEKARKGKPSLILLDIMMPKMDGFEVLANLKGNSETKDTPVVVLTNLAGDKDAERAISMGAVKYIVKSEKDPKEIAGIVKEILSDKVAHL